MKYKKQRKFDTLSDLLEYEGLQDRHVDGMDRRDPHSSWLKGVFRNSDEWKWFCKSLILKRNKKCERCGGDGHDCSGLQVHHTHPDDYTNISDESWFFVLCGKCHLQIEGFSQTEEKMKTCPRVDRKFLTVKPYRDGQRDVLRFQSGTRTIRKWQKAVEVKKNPDRYTNPDRVEFVREEQVTEAIGFMKAHQEMFK